MRVSLLGVSHSAEAMAAAQLTIPFYLERVAAGFPSPAQDYIEQTLDLNGLCIRHPAATFFVRVEGESMSGVGIHPGDILVVDRSLRAGDGDYVIACLNGEMTVKELALKPTPRLLPHHPNFQPIEIATDAEVEIFGVVTSLVRQVRR
ncbi:MAG: translesion error-prone DNA polymerase V autoproteolytic subunit [Pseudomonadota bacterium]|jgi:DNA polymerase V|nr:translesion error-prone DNA polymerase V autoproteolytic subunit [Pseudomonadota bacterium]